MIVRLRESEKKIIKKSDSEVLKEEAHGGSGSRKLYISDSEFGSV